MKKSAQGIVRRTRGRDTGILLLTLDAGRVAPMRGKITRDNGGELEGAVFLGGVR